MSSPGTITVASPPSTGAAASQILASMAALTGIATDYNPGSQIRTLAESVGATEEQQGVWTQAIAFQALVYSALSLFQITPNSAVAASGIITFQTSASGSPPAASQNVPISAGTIVQTNGGIQFQTTSDVVLLSGTGAINAPVVALVPGLVGNVANGTILNIVTGLIYPLFVTNAAGMAGGADAETSTSALARFAALIASIGLSSPVAISNAAIGVNFGTESVKFSTLYEPWIAAGSGAGSGTAGWSLYIDNGLGTATSGLITAVDSHLRGGTTTSGASNAGGAVGYRDAGVPYNIYAVTPTVVDVGVSGVAVLGGNVPVLNAAVQAAVEAYFALPFGASAQQAVIAADVSNATYGQLSALTVGLYTSGGVVPQTAISVSPSGRIILNTLTVNIVSGS